MSATHALTPRAGPDLAERETILHLLAAAAFLIFFQAFLLAPLIPSLAVQFSSTEQSVGLLVPAYMLPYGFSTLLYGPLSDRIGRKKVLLVLLSLMALTTAALASATSVSSLLLWRVAGGIANGGIIPITLALLGDLLPYNQRGRAMGWIFGAIAGGTAFGSTCGALLNPFFNWRFQLLVTAGLMLLLVLQTFRHRRLLDTSAHHPAHPLSPRAIVQNYLALFSTARGRHTYAYILLNGMFHSGLFSWLGAYLHDRYALGDTGIGLALLGYGVPGMLLGPAIGHAADRTGRRRIIPPGLALGALCAAALAPSIPLGLACGVITLLSLGFDMTHPPLVGIVTTLDAKRRGTAMGMNAFVLFTGYGLGALVFQTAMRLPGGMTTALLLFAAPQLVASLFSLHAFRQESPATTAHHA